MNNAVLMYERAGLQYLVFSVANCKGNWASIYNYPSQTETGKLGRMLDCCEFWVELLQHGFTDRQN